jgi:hypothetical protein
MRSEIARSHTDSLQEWARSWEVDPASGTGEVAFLMRRAAQQIERVLRDDPPAAAEPPAPAEVEAVRAD